MKKTAGTMLLTACWLVGCGDDDVNSHIVDAQELSDSKTSDASLLSDGATNDGSNATDGGPNTDGATNDASGVDGGLIADANIVDGGSTDGNATADAGASFSPVVWTLGDPVTNGRTQAARFNDSLVFPATPSVVVPDGDGDEINGFANSLYTSFDVSPSGQRVAYAVDTALAGTFQLVSVDRNGQNPALLTAFPATANVNAVKFSPDGEWIAFTADVEIDDTFDVYVTKADGSRANPILLSPARPGIVEDPTLLDADDLLWSSDSSKLLFTGDFTEDGYHELWVADTSGVANILIGRDDIVAVAAGTKGAIVPVSFVDETAIVKTRMDDDDVFRLKVVGTSTVSVSTLPNSELLRGDNSVADIGAVGASNDSAQIAFAADQSVLTAYEIFVMPADGSAPPTLLTSGDVAAGTNPDFSAPLVWNSDNSQIAFLADYVTDGKSEVFVVNATGGGQTRVLNVAGNTDANRDAIDVAWTLDGEGLYVVADHEVANDTELFRVNSSDSDQQVSALMSLVSDGDLTRVVVRP